ncbi:MAG TPA: hypothetical protein VGP08_15405 [Pyrinomonadaceae bacterium]|nr:hypothetical protein [Pyrinomonadaceae bacterium]
MGDDSYAEGDEIATLVPQHPSGGAALGTPNAATLLITDDATEPPTNPVDDPLTFVGTHYHDFLYRQADATGEDFWTQRIESCGANAQCLAGRRADVSAAFFLSIEFQQTGFLVIRAHKAAFGDHKSTPRYDIFLRDQAQVGEGVVVGQGDWEQRLAANRRKYLEGFVALPEFVAQFPQGMAAADYADKLFSNARVVATQGERAAAVAAYGAGDTAGRAAALMSVVESGPVYNAFYNPSFVLMQYYGYLRRNPDDAPDNNFIGYDFWLSKLDQFTRPGEDARDEAVAFGRVRCAEMVKAFIESGEYRRRFAGAPEGNQQGPTIASDGRP